MARFELELDPVDHITADAIGKPGQRVFYIQARQGERIVTVIIEKFQLQSLAVGVEQFLAEIAERFPDLPEASAEYDEERMHIHPPVEPLFRAGEIGLGYERERDRILLTVRELVESEEETEEAAIVRFWCTRDQIRAMAHWGIEVAQRGRPICPQCGQPMDPEGHFCPRKNGHKH
ncbi:MAG: DUF3090 domain-containing protein [Anaerolineae bacterium]|nr:MAG: DUF3090 domain-containing protein [Anaerolineae bacterium]